MTLINNQGSIHKILCKIEEIVNFICDKKAKKNSQSFLLFFFWIHKSRKLQFFLTKKTKIENFKYFFICQKAFKNVDVFPKNLKSPYKNKEFFLHKGT